MKHPHKALEAIEILVGGDFGMYMECILYEPKKPFKKYTIKDVAELKKKLDYAAKVITQIYRIAHADVTHGCRHELWETEKYKIIRENN